MFFIIFFQDIVFFNTLCFSEFILSHNSSSIENFINNLNTYSHNSFSDYLFKFVLIGDSGVGKSSVINRFVDNVFNPTFTPSVGVEFKYCTFETDPPNSKKLKIQIWDTAGQEKFRSIAVQFYRGANGVLVVFDLTNRTSWKNVPYWVEQVKRYNTQNCGMLLIGNKCDLHNQRVISSEEAQQAAREWGLTYIETSAKEDINIETAFKTLVAQCLEKIKTLGELQATNKMDQSFYLEAQPTRERQYGCCSGWWSS